MGVTYFAPHRREEEALMSEENKRVMRRIFEEGMNRGRLEVLDDLVAADYVDHDPNNPPDIPPGREGLKQLMSMYRAAFPDIEMTIEQQLAEGDLVTTRWTARGTHQGELAGMPPTGKQVSISGIFIDRITDGHLRESWAAWDLHGMLLQLGAIPAPAPSRR
jgi:steroid delta-isomerase-like uncharacterized protein